MNRKPWPILFVSGVFFFIPVINILFNYIFLRTGITFSEYMHGLLFLPRDQWAFFSMVVPSLVAGFAVYSVKKWSYPVFLLSMLWLSVHMLSNFPAGISVSEILFSKILPMLINITYVSYLFLPTVKAAYYNPKLRWWETKPRYITTADLLVTFENHFTKGQMLNFSEGGLLATINSYVDEEAIYHLSMVICNEEVSVKAKIVHVKEDINQYGFQFVEMKRRHRKLIKRVLRNLQKEKCQVTRDVKPWREDLKDWFKTLIKTGKGMVPVIPMSMQRSFKE